MKEYWCGNCLISMYSASQIKDACPKCGRPTIIDPKKEVKEHIEQFHKVVEPLINKEE